MLRSLAEENYAQRLVQLLKSAGMQLESWQQESGEAIARRLLIACILHPAAKS